ncbi:MAG: PQQ-dependent sugar dehydrogenase [Bacteroidetes bacterium]|nr:PQQ-dependent sugar dehydrogenase [Bacteroidota bacterium]
MKLSLKNLLPLSMVLIIAACKKDHNNNPPNNNTTPDLQQVTDGLISPVALVEPPDGSKRLFIVDQAGKIWIVQSDGTRSATPFIDLSSKIVALNPGYDERGLLGLAFHPDFKTNGKFYLFYTAPPRAGGPQPGASWSSLTRISQFTAAGGANTADPATEKVILEADHPQSNHNGGTIAFGPDGFLYISIGDGGNADDIGPGHVTDWYGTNAGGNGQDLYANLLGNILRIDVNSGSPYSIPADNPFVASSTAQKEIYAYGFRNPYRFSFDMGGSHQLFAGDAGQSLYEEIDLVTKGGNYGWNVREGAHCFSTDNDKQERTSCPTTDSAGKPLIDPIIELVNAANPKGGGVAVTIVGGNVYRGTQLPSYQGRYIFGIFSQDGKTNAKLYVADAANSGMWPYTELKPKSFPTDLGMYVKSIGQDQSGEIYVMTSMQQGPSGATGKVYKLIGTK